MAERIIRQLVDDLDGTEIVEGQGGRVEFGFRGVSYAVDLHASNMAKLEKALAPFIKAATRVGGRATRRPKEPTNGIGNGRVPGVQLAAIRQWATKNGYQVSSRGRNPAEVMKAFHESH